jgi:hypothetical protein
MEWLALLVPVFLSILAFVLYQKKLVWWEIILPVFASIIIIMICKWSMVKNLVSDTEYYSAYVDYAMHYDQWNEYIQKTCSYTTCSGTGKSRSCVTHYYDCSYVQNHPEYWEATLNTGSEKTISEEKYNSLRKTWKNEEFVEMNRHYHTIDGDAQRTIWDNKFNNLNIYDSSGQYDNKPQTAETVFHFKDLDSIQKLKVVDYPEIEESKQNSCVGCNDYDKVTLRKINGLQGKKHQIKIFVLIFKNQKESVAELQKQYWKGGNKNELVICVDSKSRWAKSFSWSDDKRLESQANQLFMNEHLTIRKKLIELNKLVPKLWKRKQFSDFDYIDVQLTTNQLIWIYIITFIVSIGILIFGISNDINDEN